MGRAKVAAHISELTNINQSLHTLSRCIEALAKPGGERSYIPYRESKHTGLVQDSLGGSAKTRLFAMLSPSWACAREAQATLWFADCAKRVMQHVTIKETRAIDHVLVNRLEKEVQELRAKLRMQSAQLQNCTSAGVSAAGAAPALASSMSSPQLGPATTSAQQHQRADPAAAAADAAAAGAPASPHVVVKTVASSQVLEELAQYRKRCASLESILEAIDKCANRFFRFEIEEDEIDGNGWSLAQSQSHSQTHRLHGSYGIVAGLVVGMFFRSACPILLFWNRHEWSVRAVCAKIERAHGEEINHKWNEIRTAPAEQLRKRRGWPKRLRRKQCGDHGSGTRRIGLHPAV